MTTFLDVLVVSVRVGPRSPNKYVRLYQNLLIVGCLLVILGVRNDRLAARTIRDLGVRLVGVRVGPRSPDLV